MASLGDHMRTSTGNLRSSRRALRVPVNHRISQIVMIVIVVIVVVTVRRLRPMTIRTYLWHITACEVRRQSPLCLLAERARGALPRRTSKRHVTQHHVTRARPERSRFKRSPPFYSDRSSITGAPIHHSWTVLF